MFNIKIRADILKEVVELSSCIVEEVKLSFKKDHLSLRAVDPSHVAMIELNLSKNAFEEFKTSEQDIGVNLNKMKDMLRVVSSEEMFIWGWESKRNRILLQVGNLKRSMLPVDLGGMTDPRVPDLTLPSKVTVDMNELKKGIRAAESISDHVAFIISPEDFRMEAEGDTEKMELAMTRTAGITDITAPGQMKSLYPLDYLTAMVKAIAAPYVTILMANDYPARIEFQIGGGVGDGAYLLAPRIENV